LGVLGLLLVLNVSAQKQGYEFRTFPVNDKLQTEIGKDYRFVGFVVKGIKTEAQKQALQKSLSSNSQFKKVRINGVNEFHGFIQKDLKAVDVRKILQSQGFDFVFDKYKFKGDIMQEQYNQTLEK